MEAIDRCEPITLDELYDGYVQACGELRIAPLQPDDLPALIQALAERDATTFH